MTAGRADCDGAAELHWRHVVMAVAVVVAAALLMPPNASFAQDLPEDTEIWIAHGKSDLLSVFFSEDHVWLHSGRDVSQLAGYHLLTGERDAARGFLLRAAGRARSAWSDGTTVWVAAADRESAGSLRADPGLVAYLLADGARAPNRDACITGHRYPTAPAYRPVPAGVASDGSDVLGVPGGVAHPVRAPAAR